MNYPKKKDLILSDCGDNSCLFAGKNKGGMRTNGGCRCIDNFINSFTAYLQEIMSEKNLKKVLLKVDGNSCWIGMIEDGRITRALRELVLGKEKTNG